MNDQDVRMAVGEASGACSLPSGDQLLRKFLGHFLDPQGVAAVLDLIGDEDEDPRIRALRDYADAQDA